MLFSSKHSNKYSNKNRYRMLFYPLVIVAFVIILCAPVYGEQASDITYAVNGTELVISGSGDIPDYTTSSPAPWSEYKSEISSVKISDGITGIGNMAFFSFSKLQYVSVPEGVVYLGDSAFYNCVALKEINFPSGLNEIGEYAFERCLDLSSVGGITASTISEGAFSGCSALESIELLNVTEIKKYAFEKCSSLSSIKLPLSLIQVYQNAFSGCTSLIDVLYQGTSQDYENILFLSGNETIINSKKTWHYGVHDYSEVLNTVVPTCTAEGYTVYSCSCGETEKRDILSALGHSYIQYTGRDDGDTHTAQISYCTSCGDCIYQIIGDEEVPKSYTVTWIINNLKFTETYFEGEIPGGKFGSMEYVAENGAKYKFVGFSPEITAVNENVTYHALFEAVDGFSEIDGATYYFSNGNRLSGWQEIDGCKYYFLKSTGEMVTGIKTIGGVEYKFNFNGTLFDGFDTDDYGTKYYVDGVSVRQWYTIGGKTYYFYISTGYMLQAEQKVIAGFTREFNEDYSVKPISGWQIVNNKIYYYRNGTVQTGWQEIEGKKYYFLRSDDRYGEMTWGWQAIGGKLYYFYSYKGSAGSGGDLYQSSGYIGGVYYNVSEDGYVMINRMFDDGIGIRYYDHTYTYVRNYFLTYDGKKYYFGSDGYAIVGKTVTINGVEYTFDEDGVCIE